MKNNNLLTRRALEEAAEWLMHFQDQPPIAQNNTEFQRWLDANQDNPRAWQKAEQLAGRMQQLPPAMAQAALNRADSPARRDAIKRLVLMIALVPAGWAGWRHIRPQMGWMTDASTATGEQRQLRIQDGSVVTLNTDSAIDIHLDQQRRLIHLLRGEINIQTSDRADSRPFLVQTSHGLMRALGTVFSVRDHGEFTRLAVHEGAVEIQTVSKTVQVIQAGQQVDFTPKHIAHPTTLDTSINNWLKGMLVANAMPLGLFCTELNRYRAGRLRVDPAVAELPVSGAFPLTNPVQALSMLTSTYPVRVEQSLFGLLTTILPK